MNGYSSGWIWLGWVVLAILAGCQSGRWNRFADVNQAIMTDADAEKLIQRESPGTFRWSSDYGRVMEQATKEQKPMMLLFTGSDWCSYCMKLDKEVLSKPEFNSWANEKFVPMIVDFPKTKRLASDISAQNQQLQERYRRFVDGYPTVLFVQPDGQVIGKMGYERGGAQQWIESAERQLAPALARASTSGKADTESAALQPAVR